MSINIRGVAIDRKSTWIAFSGIRRPEPLRRRVPQYGRDGETKTTLAGPPRGALGLLALVRLLALGAGLARHA